MAMVGLFWIAEGDVYVGAKPSGLAPGARLTPEGVMALGDGQEAFFPWEDVHALTAADAPVKSLKRNVGAVGQTVKRNVGMLLDLALGVGLGTEEAPTMTLRVTDADGGDTELMVYTAAAIGYSQAEHDLSLELLTRLTEGAGTLHTTLAAMADWGRGNGGSTPRAAEREGLLREWVGG